MQEMPGSQVASRLVWKLQDYCRVLPANNSDRENKPNCADLISESCFPASINRTELSGKGSYLIKSEFKNLKAKPHILGNKNTITSMGAKDRKRLQESWLSKLDAKSYNEGTSTVGFDMTKLYPELSAKLGLVKASCDETNRPNKNGLLSKERMQKSYINGKIECIISENGIKVLSGPAVYVKSNSLKTLNKKLFSRESSESCLEVTDKVPFKECLNKHDKTFHSSILSSSKDCKTIPKIESLVSVSSHISSTQLSEPKVVMITPKKQDSPPFMDPSLDIKLSPAIMELHRHYSSYSSHSFDLYPLGVDDDSDISDDEGSYLYNVHDANLHVEDYRKQIYNSRVRLKGLTTNLERKLSLTHSLVQVARSDPSIAAQVVGHYTKGLQYVPHSKEALWMKSSLLLKRYCVHKGNNSESSCKGLAIPGTRHCSRHITYNVDQQLFSHCAARLHDNSFCNVPVLDIGSSLPLCREHKNLQIVTQDTTPERESFVSKIKPARKRNKMPILSRYGKSRRSKKKKRSTPGYSSSIIPSTKIRPPVASQSSISSSSHPSPGTPYPSSQFSSCSESATSGIEECMLDDMEKIMGTLPIETGASRFLNSNDFQDILSTPVETDEFSNLFDDPEVKSDELEDDVIETDEGTNMDGSVMGDITTEAGDESALSIDETLSELSTLNPQELNTLVLSMVQEGNLNLSSLGIFSPLTNSTEGFQDSENDLQNSSLQALGNREMLVSNESNLVPPFTADLDSVVSGECKSIVTPRISEVPTFN